MFGYICPMECELRVREQKEYRAYYCGLCKAIGVRYGLVARLTLNYDCAFLCAFLCAHTGTADFRQRRCLCHPFRSKQPMAALSPAVAYAADVNVLLAFYAACDNWQDEHKPSALLLRCLFGPARKRAAANEPALAKEIADCLKRLSALEKAQTPCTDEPSDAFGALMRAIIRHAPGVTDADLPACEWMFYNLGRWVYLIDAWDDREKDRKAHAYNPFLAAGMPSDEAAFLLHISLTEAQRGYDLIDMAGSHGLIDNIMELGCRMKTRQCIETKENAE